MTAEATLELPEEISIANVADWKNRLQSQLQGGATVNINAADLSRVDTAAIQLLAAFVIAAKEQQITVNWLSVSGSLRTTAERLGLADTLFA